VTVGGRGRFTSPTSRVPPPSEAPVRRGGCRRTGFWERPETYGVGVGVIAGGKMTPDAMMNEPLPFADVTVTVTLTC